MAGRPRTSTGPVVGSLQNPVRETAQFDEYALHVPDTVVITGTAAVICNVNVQEMSSTSFSAKSDIWRAVHGPIPK